MVGIELVEKFGRTAAAGARAAATGHAGGIGAARTHRAARAAAVVVILRLVAAPPVLLFRLAGRALVRTAEAAVRGRGGEFRQGDAAVVVGVERLEAGAARGRGIAAAREA